MKLPNYMIGLLALCLQTSCNSDNNMIGGQTEPEAEVEAEFVSHLKQYAGSSSSLLPQGISVGIYAAPYNQMPSASASDHSNIRYVSTPSGNLTSTGRLKLQEGEDYTFYAYAPYKTLTPVNSENIPFVHGEDVLLCMENPSLQKVSYDNRSVSFNFAHLTPQIQFVVKVSENAGIGSLQSTSVLRASGFLPEAQLNLNTGKLTSVGEPSEKTDVTVAATPDEKGVYHLSSDPVCFFVTPNEPMNIHLRITHEGVTHTGDIATLFVPGESSVYTVWLNSQPELEITTHITDWINQYESIDIN